MPTLTAFGNAPYVPPAPTIYTYGSRLGRPNSSNIGAFGAERQIDEIFLPALQQRGDAARQALINANLLSRQSGSPPTPTGMPVAGAIPPTQAGPFTSVALTKDPEIEQFVNELMARIGSANTSELVREPRSTRLGEAVGNAYERFQGDVNNTRQSLEDFNREFLAVRPQETEILAQETGAIGNFFGDASDPNSLISQLNRIAEDRARAVGTVSATDRANVERLAKGNMLTGNRSSYLTNQVFNVLQNLRAEEARQQADLARANLLGVANLQAGTAGRRGDLISQYLATGLVPLSAQQQVSTNELARLGQLGNIDLSNLLLERGGDQIARDAGLVALINQLRRGGAPIRYEGLQQTLPTTRFPSVDFGGGPVGPTADYGQMLDALLGLQNIPYAATPAGPTQPALNTTAGAPATEINYPPGMEFTNSQGVTYRMGSNGTWIPLDYARRPAADYWTPPTYVPPVTEQPMYDFPGLPTDIFNVTQPQIA